MKNLMYLFILTGSIIAAAVQISAQQSEKTVPLIVELFTSEGCSTCPPADKYLQTLLQKQPIAGAEIIGLSEHVDYWNQFGWTDPFSSNQFSSRQKYYAAFFKRKDIYTPQFVVDGTHEVTAKDANKALAEIAKTQKGNVSVQFAGVKDDLASFTIKINNLPKVSDGDKAVVLLAVTEDDLTSSVSAGENSGRKLNHMAVTRYLKTIGEMGEQETALSADVTLGKDWKRDNLSAVVLVQEAASRRILGAAKISFKG